MTLETLLMVGVFFAFESYPSGATDLRETSDPKQLLLKQCAGCLELRLLCIMRDFQKLPASLDEHRKMLIDPFSFEVPSRRYVAQVFRSRAQYFQ